MGRKMRRIMLFVCLMLAPLLSFAKLSEKLPLPQELQASELPWFALVAGDGEAYNSVINRNNLKDIAKQGNNQSIILSFFATWCIPCREGLKLLGERTNELKENGILVVLVDVGEDDYDKVSKWAKQYAKKEWLLGFDKFGNIPEKFGLVKPGADMPFPRTLLLDSNLRPIMLIGNEGSDYPQILLSKPAFSGFKD